MDWPPVGDEGRAYDARHLERPPYVRVAGVPAVIAEHEYVSRGYCRRFERVVRGLPDVWLLELYPVHVHTAPAAVLVDRALRARVGPDLDGLSLDGYHPFDEIFRLLGRFEDDDIAALRAM